MGKKSPAEVAWETYKDSPEMKDLPRRQLRKREFIAGFEAGLSAQAPQEEPEWEHGAISATALQVARRQGWVPNVAIMSNTPGSVEYQREQGYVILRRTRAGEWEEVPA